MKIINIQKKLKFTNDSKDTMVVQNKDGGIKFNINLGALGTNFQLKDESLFNLYCFLDDYLENERETKRKS